MNQQKTNGFIYSGSNQTKSIIKQVQFGREQVQSRSEQVRYHERVESGSEQVQYGSERAKHF